MDIIDEREIARLVIEHFESEAKRLGKPIFYPDVIKAAAQVAAVAIKEYHIRYHQSDPARPKNYDNLD